MNVDYWDRHRWEKELKEQDVWVMTPQILLNILRHGFIKVHASATHYTQKRRNYCDL